MPIVQQIIIILSHARQVTAHFIAPDRASWLAMFRTQQSTLDSDCDASLLT
jgi:hypothetical protein